MKKYAGEKDCILVEKTLMGDSLAYEELVLRHESSVKGTAYKVTGNYFSAEDASQDAFVSAWANLNTLKDWDKFGSWVCAIAKNRAKCILRSYSYAAADISLNLLENIDLFDTEEADVHAIVSLKDESAELHEAVNALSDKIKEAIRLHYFEGLSIEEIAKKLSIPCGTVKWRLCEGRKQLRKGYGIMENTYDDKEALVRRVMRQVEELKLWRLKNSSEGFEKAYRGVLSSVEGLKDSKEKSHALADVLNMGYWWLKSEKTESNKARIEKAAFEGHNEDVMTSLVSQEFNGLTGQEKIDYMEFTQLPRLERDGFVKSMGYVKFWMGYEYLEMDDYDKALECFRSCIEMSEPSNAYYAASAAAISALEKRQRAKAENDSKILGINITGETFKVIDGKLYFWSQPGFSDDILFYSHNALFGNTSYCDSLICDPDMHYLDKKVSSDGKTTLTCIKENARVTTPAGRFDKCKVFELNGDTRYFTRCTTWFCPGIGIVRQECVRDGESFEWNLCEYTIKGGSGLMPLAAGNRWEYSTPYGKDGVISDTANIYEVTYVDDTTAVCSSELKLYCEFDLDTVIGNISRAGYEFEAGENVTELKDVTEYIKRAGELASTESEKLISSVFSEVHNRILETEISRSPDCTQVGRQNRFDMFDIEKKNGEIRVIHSHSYCYLWQYLMTYQTADAYKSWYNTCYENLFRACQGVMWSDAWVPGYHSKRMERFYKDTDGKLYPIELSVLENEAVTTPAGEFKNCRHLRLEQKAELADRNCYCGIFDFWFAEGVGVVKMSRPLWKFVENIWWLMEYKGTGEGYFPIEDGLFRRYEPKDLGGGWTASTEYTYSQENGKTVIVANMTANQERKIFEKEEAARRERECVAHNT